MPAEPPARLAPAQETLLRRLLGETFGPDVQLVRYGIANEHADYYVLLATLRRPNIDIVIKLAGRDAPCFTSFERTAALHRLVVGRTSVPMPDILAIDRSCAVYPWRYLITRQVPGQEWATIRQQLPRQQLAVAYQQIGVAIAQLHTISFESFGELAADGTVRPASDALEALAARANRVIRQPELRELFLKLLHQRRQLFADVTRAALCHDDLHHHNILFRQERNHWQLAAILDFDKAWAGPAESDLARLELWRGMTSDTFWQAYHAVQAVAPGYVRRRPIYQLLWCLEYAVESPQHNADTQRVCAELGIPPVRFD